MFFHKNPLEFFVFLPWVAFWGQAGPSLPDYARLRAGIATDVACKQVSSSFDVTVVRTEESREKGLSGRSTPLAKNEGMLFIFDEPRTVSFWMKDTLIPLELVLFDSNGKLTEFFEMPVERDPKNPAKHYIGRKPAMTALELAPGAIKSLTGKPATLCLNTIPRR